MKKVTIQDIANLAGVSKSTVSRSLNNNSMIAASTRSRIQKLARDLNFSYNANARSLTLNKVDTIGIITSEDRSVTDYIDLLTGSVREYFESRGIDVLIAHANNAETGESNIQRLVQTAKVSGLFIISPEVRTEDWSFLKETGFPSVIVHFRPENTCYSDFNCFFVDNEKGGYFAAELLIKNGRHRLLTLTEGKGQIQFLDRTAGFIRAIEKHNLKESRHNIIEGECSYEFAYQVIRDKISLFRQIDGIFVQSDVMAAGVLNALQDMKIIIPDDIAVVGFDDVTFSSYLRPGLTTIRQPRTVLIEEASRNLFNQMEGQKQVPEVKIYEPRVIIRQSCR